jgi:hypothetical protein
VIRKLYLREAASTTAKKAMTNIVKRGIDASPPAEKQWGDALIQAVDDFDIEVRPAGSGGKDAPKDAKKASATGKKPDAKAAAPTGGDDFFSDFKKQMGSSKKDAPKPSPTASPKPADADLGDDWFTDDDDVSGAEKEPEADDGDDFPDLPAPEPASFHVGADDSEEEYKSPFGVTGFGGSSWDDVPDWMRDPEKMPMPGGGSRRVPGSAKPSGGAGPSPVGKPWSPKDAAKTGDPDANKPKKPGLLGRVFGRKK